MIYYDVTTTPTISVSDVIVEVIDVSRSGSAYYDVTNTSTNTLL